ncbi:MAG: SpoIID/LytB domain-containing protein, partial [Elusimicrobiaceae bacterium]|nr:SpoIID/LytB domain-containing protein [Elusimicrobiaceae bacterium]
MKKLFLTCCWLGCFCSAFGAAYTVQERLQEAADLYFSHRPKEALERYVQISKDSGERTAFLNAIFIAMEQNLPKEAVDIALEAYRLYPQDNTLSEMAAEALLADGQYAAAERMLSLLKEDNKTAGFFHINLARAQLGLHEKKLAIYNLKQAVKAGSHPSLAHFLLGQVYEDDKNYKKAADEYQQAVDYDHQFMEARLHLAHMLEKTKQYPDAYRHYKMIFAADAKNTAAAQALARIKPLLKKEKEEKTDTPATPWPTFTPLEKITLPPGRHSPLLKIGLGVSQNGHASPRTQVTFSPSADFIITNAQGKRLAAGKGGEVWSVKLAANKPVLHAPSGRQIPFTKTITVIPSTPTASIVVKNLLSGPGMSWASVGNKEYRGKLQVLHNASARTLVPINLVSLEEYVQGIMAAEMPAGFPAQALRAQAVLARTYALKHLGKHKKQGYDLCDAQNCQVYGGVQAETPAGNSAVQATLGEVLTYQGKAIEGVFSANCGGATQSAKEAGWNETPYLDSVSDYQEFDFHHVEPYHFKELLQYPSAAYSKYDKNVSLAAFRWARVVSEEEVRRVIKNQKKDIGTITALIPLARSRAGYVTKLLVQGSKGSVTLEKENVIRNNL